MIKPDYRLGITIVIAHREFSTYLKLWYVVCEKMVIKMWRRNISFFLSCRLWVSLRNYLQPRPRYDTLSEVLFEGFPLRPNVTVRFLLERHSSKLLEERSRYPQPSFELVALFLDSKSYLSGLDLQRQLSFHFSSTYNKEKSILGLISGKEE